MKGKDMEKQMTIGGEEYTLKCSILTSESFERTTGKKFGSAITRYQKLSKAMNVLPEDEANAYIVENIFDIEMDALQIAYCMIQEAKRKGFNQDFNKTMEEFISDVGTLSSEELKGVLQLAASLFPRAVQK